MLDTNAIYLVLGLAYLAAVGWYLINVVVASRDPKKAKSSSGKGSRHRAGKRCPQCKKIIDKRRSVCQHCGYMFRGEAAETHSEGGEMHTTDDDMSPGRESGKEGA